MSNVAPTGTLKPNIVGKYTFTIKNIGDSPIDLSVDCGSSATQLTL